MQVSKVQIDYKFSISTHIASGEYAAGLCNECSTVNIGWGFQVFTKIPHFIHFVN